MKTWTCPHCGADPMKAMAYDGWCGACGHELRGSVLVGSAEREPIGKVSSWSSFWAWLSQWFSGPATR